MVVRPSWAVAASAALILWFGGLGCSAAPSTFDDPEVVRQLLVRERELARATLPTLSLPVDSGQAFPVTRTLSSIHLLDGSDPFRILAVNGGYLVLLRGASQIVVLDGSLREKHRLNAPRAPRSWTMTDSTRLVLGGEFDSRLRVYAIGPETDALSLREVAAVEIPGVLGVSDVAFDAATRSLILADPWGEALLEVPCAELLEGGSVQAESRSVRHPRDVVIREGVRAWTECQGRALIVASGRDTARIVHDGPIWSFDLEQSGDTTWVVAGGIEDHPLDRRSGEFGYVDSYLFVYRVAGVETGVDIGVDARVDPGVVTGAGFRWEATCLASLNLSEAGVITPKRVRWGARSRTIEVAGFGGERWVRCRFDPSTPELRIDSSFVVPPGVSDFIDEGEAGLLWVDPLLDRVVRRSWDGMEAAAWVADTGSGSHDPETRLFRLGEVLFHSELLAPHNHTRGLRSRFSCEACHFEGGIDGRTHYTGRAAIHATSKPVRGLLHNIPLFSRAGDPVLAAMVMAEFRVANQDRADRFVLDPEDHPWLRTLGFEEALEPSDQRRALLEFLALWQPKPQPRRLERLDRLARQGQGAGSLRPAGGGLPSDAERGLSVFRDRCAHCHQPIRTTRTDLDLEARDLAVAFDAWNGWLLDPATDLIWGMDGLCSTGVEPYVSRAGARVPSLRRVAWKFPYFTNGSAESLAEVLRAFRYRGLEAWHGAGPTTPVPADAMELTESEMWRLEELLGWF